MRTMQRHHRLMLGIVAVEILAIGMLLAWAITKDTDKSASPAAGTTAETARAPQVALQPFAEGLEAPVGIVSTGDPEDARLFVVEQAGKIRTVSSAGQLEPQVFLDIVAKVQFDGEMGLLGLAFHPNYKQNGYFYINYVDKQQNTIIARYTLDKTTARAATASEKVLFKIKQPYRNHNGGGLQFGPDGYLYIALGDGGSGGDPHKNGQSKQTLLGKILRIDVDKGDPYSVPPTNPFAKETGAKPEIWALGLRNPWRISFDRQTGDLFIADVGQDAYEELNFQKAGTKGGENYGWRCYEGLHVFDAGCQDAATFTSPVLEYNHDEDRCSITGGNVYRGSSEPQLAGKYFYADYCGGQVYYAEQKNGAWSPTLAAQTDFGITTFGEDSKGELYLADAKKGTLYRIEDAANN